MTARLMRFPRQMPSGTWWSAFHVYDSRQTPEGWRVGLKTLLFLWARKSTPACAVLSSASRFDILRVTGRMKTAVWRRKNKPVRTAGIDIFEARNLGLWEFTPHRKMSINKLRLAEEKRRVDELHAAQLSADQLAEKTDRLLAEFGDEV